MSEKDRSPRPAPPSPPARTEHAGVPGAAPDATELVAMRGITKIFPGVKALDDVDLTLHKGEVLGLLGENGAGKSTLMNVLGGVLQPDAGRIRLDGEPVRIGSVLEAQNDGIAFVHQETSLELYMTTAENVFLGQETRNKAGLVSQELMDKKALPYLHMVGLDINPRTMVNRLSLGQQQMVEIARALSLDSRVLVLDEPTSSLSEAEIRNLFAVVNQLKARGIGILFISHKMSEIFELTDRVLVMRDGHSIGTVVTKDTTEDELVHMMVGRSIQHYYSHSRHATGEVVFEVRDYSCAPWNTKVSFQARQGEVVGFYGLIGAGRSELFESIVGFRPRGSGTVSILGRKVGPKDSPERLQDEGLAMVPEDRKSEGLFLYNDVKFNSSIQSLKKFIRHLRVDEKKEQQIVDTSVRELNIKISSTAQRVGNLSGGNQQKVLLGKWLATGPQILILDEPTKGIDVGAKAEIYERIDELAKQGVCVLLISSELEEAMNMSDRLVVMREGAIRSILPAGDFDQDTILKLALAN